VRHGHLCEEGAEQLTITSCSCMTPLSVILTGAAGSGVAYATAEADGEDSVGALSVIDRLGEQPCLPLTAHFLDPEQLGIARLVPNTRQDSLHWLLCELVHVFDKGRLVHLMVYWGCMTTGHGLSPVAL
jgi:hypothetical protein